MEMDHFRKNEFTEAFVIIVIVVIVSLWLLSSFFSLFKGLRMPTNSCSNMSFMSFIFSPPIILLQMRKEKAKTGNRNQDVTLVIVTPITIPKNIAPKNERRMPIKLVGFIKE